MPKQKGGERYMKTMVLLDPQDHKTLRHLAVDDEVSMSELVRRAVKDYLKKRGKKIGKEK